LARDEIPQTLSFVRAVRVGSLNAPKIEATRSAVEGFCGAVEVRGIDVPSGVSEQPVGWGEIVLGARNRANSAFVAEAPDLAVGIEDGLIEIPGLDGVIFNIGCAAITDGRRESCAFSAVFPYPQSCAEPAVKSRSGIGDAFDSLWLRHRGAESSRTTEKPGTPSSKTVGNIGKLSLGILNRDQYAEQAVICALLRFIHPDLYGDDDAPRRQP
jgi:inosine/xanthosine triphosphatase